MKAISWAIRGLRFVKSRLSEKSTWAAIGVGIAGGAALAPPYSWLFIAAGVIGALIPEPARKTN